MIREEVVRRLNLLMRSTDGVARRLVDDWYRKGDLLSFAGSVPDGDCRNTPAAVGRLVRFMVEYCL